VIHRNPTLATPDPLDPGWRRGAGGRRRAGLTLVELLLVTGILFVLAGILLVTLGPARKMARVSRCTSHLRQIGLAYGMYQQDHGQYPDPQAITMGTYVKDNRILFCPEDTTVAVLGAASSYRYRDKVPPEFTPLAETADLDPNIVLAGCQHHLGQQVIVLKGDDTRLTPPEFPFHLVLRAGGNVERIHLSQIRKFFQSGEQPILQTLYPGEPGYESGRVMASAARP
jgi:type II secretory pathway pseudopilin PulG